MNLGPLGRGSKQKRGRGWRAAPKPEVFQYKGVPTLEVFKPQVPPYCGQGNVNYDAVVYTL